MLKTKNLKKLKYRLIWLYEPYAHYTWNFSSIKKYFPRVKKYKMKYMFRLIGDNKEYEKKFLILIKEVIRPPWKTTVNTVIVRALVNKNLDDQVFRLKLDDKNFAFVNLIDAYLKFDIKENRYIIKVYQRYLRRYGNKDR